jgi:hypothetical protein
MVKMSAPSHEKRFQANVVGLAELLQDIVEEVQRKGYKVIQLELLRLATSLLSKMNPEDLINGFIRYSHLHWDKIHERNRDFFIHNAQNVFGDLPFKDINAFKNLFELQDSRGNYVVSKEDENDIWSFFSPLVKICIKYIHSKRQPKLIQGKRGEERIYEGTFMPEIKDLHIHAARWKVVLDFPAQ